MGWAGVLESNNAGRLGLKLLRPLRNARSTAKLWGYRTM